MFNFASFDVQRLLPCENEREYLRQYYDHDSIDQKLIQPDYVRDYGCYSGGDVFCDSTCSVDATPWQHFGDQDEWCNRKDLQGDDGSHCCEHRSNQDEEPDQTASVYCCWIGQMFWSYTGKGLGFHK